MMVWNQCSKSLASQKHYSPFITNQKKISLVVHFELKVFVEQWWIKLILKGVGGPPPENFEVNKAGEAISGNFLRAILPLVNNQFQRILLPFILYALFKYKI